VTGQQYVSWLIKRIGGNLFSRTDLVDAINQAQNEILGRDIAYMRLNPDGYIHTAAGTYEYAASTYIYDGVANTTRYDIRTVKRIWTYNIRNSNIFAYGGINKTTHRPEYEVNAYASDEIEVPFDLVPSIAANSTDCKVRFWSQNDPGTTTDVLRVSAYRWPTQFTAETVALSIPDQFQRGLLKYAVLRDLEYTEYGSADRPEVMYEKELKKFDLWANGIITTQQTCTLPREV
jgi:hypothetical protein